MIHTTMWFTLGAIHVLLFSCKFDPPPSPLRDKTIDLFRGACAVKGNVQVAGHVKPAPFLRRDVTL